MSLDRDAMESLIAKELAYCEVELEESIGTPDYVVLLERKRMLQIFRGWLGLTEEYFTPDELSTYMDDFNNEDET